MRLTQHIFLWVSLAVLLPLVILIALATVWSESLYREQITSEINTELTQWTSEVDRKRSFDREMITALANTPELQNYLPVLEATLNDEIHSEYFDRSETLARFLEGFSAAIPSLAGVRVLDIEGNSVIRIRFLAGEPIWDPELEASDSELVSRLDQLPSNEVSYLTHPDLHPDFELPPIHDAIYPLQFNGQRVGYLVALPNGRDMDRILDFTARPYGAEIFVFELNEENTVRDGLILYDDQHGARMANPRFSVTARIEKDERLRTEAQTEPYGHYVADQEPRMVFFHEYYPYPRRLISWIVGVRIDSSGLAAPFKRIQLGLISVSILALLAILVLVRFTTRRFAQPIETISEALNEYAEGKQKTPLPIQGPEEIQELQHAFNRMTEHLEIAHQERDRAQEAAHQNAKLASIGQIAAGIGHELNNPLNHILTLTKLMERTLKPDDNAMREDLESLREEAQRASRIIAGVLEFARQREISPAYFGTEEWLERCVRSVADQANDKGIHLQIASAVDHLYGDADQLQQVMINLLGNAIHASPQGSTIGLSIESSDEMVDIRIDDEGRGIPSTERSRIFDPFYTTKPVGEGTGLGLSISLGIVEQHGGQLRLESRQTQGTRANIRLPLMEQAP